MTVSDDETTAGAVLASIEVLAGVVDAMYVSLEGVVEIADDTVSAGAEVADVSRAELVAQLSAVTVTVTVSTEHVDVAAAAAHPLAVSAISTHFDWPETGVVYKFHSLSDAGQA